MFLEIDDHDATALAKLIKGREISPLELLEDSITRCEALNPKINAVITTMYDQAIERAKRITSEEVFSGVPFLMKDFVAEIKGVPFNEGSDFLDGYVPEQDSYIYQKFSSSGLVTFGKTNLPEFAIGTTTEPKRFGPTLNPWNPKLTPGGSSGGAAAAVASGIVPMAHANDVGGSIRIPASCCGLVGLKPSRGRSSLGPHYGDIISGFLVEHAVTRSVRDSATLLDVTSQNTIGDPYYAPKAQSSFTKQVGVKPKPLKIGFSTVTPLGDPLDPECKRAVLETVELLSSLGHELVENAPEFNAMEFWERYTTVLASGVAWVVDDWSRRLGRDPSPDLLEPFVFAFAERGRKVTAPEYLLALQDVQRGVRDFSQFFVDHDLTLTSTLGQPPVALNTLTYRGDPFELRRRTAKFSPYTYLSNATGQPAISLPLFWTEDNLPIGIHFTARYGDEATLIQLASQLEEAIPWANRRPQIHATHSIKD
tara:strand:- start:4261 stop:5703 length:1443 start_codon:yes stop_codon:yes gene_type:complete